MENKGNNNKEKALKAKKELTAYDAYLNRVFKIAILAPSIATATAAIYFTLFKALGWYPNIPIWILILFDLMDVLFMVTSVWLMKTSFTTDGVLKPHKLKLGKIFTVAVIILQWNAISYMSPVREWWAFMFFFAAFGMLYFDIKMMLVSVIGVSVSTFISWVLVDGLFVVMSEDMTKEFVIRLCCVIWTMTILLVLTHFAGKYLVEELEKYAHYDALTNLLNRKTLSTHLEEACSQAKSGKTQFCILMLDIDNFKHVNDTYGHEAGDEVLVTIANVVKSSVRKEDVVFRWGGEEVLVLVQSGEEVALKIAERIRKTVEETEIKYENNIIRKTVTIGLMPYNKDLDIEAMIKEADDRLYYGKNHGKNQVVSETMLMAEQKETTDTNTEVATNANA